MTTSFYRMEIQQIKGATYVRIAFTSLKQIQIRLQIFISILTYAILGNYISAQKVNDKNTFKHFTHIRSPQFVSFTMCPSSTTRCLFNN